MSAIAFAGMLSARDLAVYEHMLSNYSIRIELTSQALAAGVLISKS